MVCECEVNDGLQGYVVWPGTATQLSCHSACLCQGACMFSLLFLLVLGLVCDLYANMHFFSPTQPHVPFKWDLRNKISGESTGRKDMLD